MKKNVFGRKFGRDKNERTALFKSLMSSLVMHERITISESKAKAIRPQIERLVTKAKIGENSSLRVLEQSLSRPAFDKMVSDIGPRFSKRPGGYTRIVRLGKRFGDDAPEVLIEWVQASEIVTVVPAVKTQASKSQKKQAVKPVKKKTAPKAKPTKAQSKPRKSTVKKK